jgi:hypothetical protein
MTADPTLILRREEQRAGIVGAGYQERGCLEVGGLALTGEWRQECFLRFSMERGGPSEGSAEGVTVKVRQEQLIFSITMNVYSRA